MNNIINLDQIERNIITYFLEKFTYGTKVVFENIEHHINDDQPFILFNVDSKKIEQISIGSPENNQYRCYGEVSCEILTPKNTGSGEAIRIAQSLSEIFSFKEIGRIFFKQSKLKKQQINKIYNDNNWFNMTIVIEFVVS